MGDPIFNLKVSIENNFILLHNTLQLTKVRYPTLLAISLCNQSLFFLTSILIRNPKVCNYCEFCIRRWLFIVLFLFCVFRLDAVWISFTVTPNHVKFQSVHLQPIGPLIVHRPSTNHPNHPLQILSKPSFHDVGDIINDHAALGPGTRRSLHRILIPGY